MYSRCRKIFHFQIMSSKQFFRLNAPPSTGLETSILPPQAQGTRKHRALLLKGLFSYSVEMEYFLHGFERTNKQTI